MCQRMLNLMSIQINKRNVTFGIKRHNPIVLICFFGFVCFAVANGAGRAAGVAATAGGSAMVLYKLYCIYDEYDKCKNHCIEMETKLNLLKSHCDGREADKDKLKEKMELFQ